MTNQSNNAYANLCHVFFLDKQTCVMYKHPMAVWLKNKNFMNNNVFYVKYFEFC